MRRREFIRPIGGAAALLAIADEVIE